MASREKRQYTRVEVSWPVSILTGRGLIEGKVKNVSFGGAYIQCQVLPKTDKVFDLSILIPGQDDYSIMASAEMVWSRTHNNNSLPSFDMGVRFLDISEEDLRLISNIALL